MHLTANAKGATVLGSIPASSGTVESEGRQMKQRWIQYIDKIPMRSASYAKKRHLNVWTLKGLSHEIDLKNFDKNLQNLT